MSGPHFKVVEPGLSTTVQDFGRHGHQALGVPVSGALDLPALRLANALVGNSEDCAALEIRMIGPTLEVAADAVRVALAGTSAGIELVGDTPRRWAAGRSVRFPRGTRFRVGPLRDVACACLAVEGGFDLAPVFGSLSTYVRGGFGGLDGRALAAGDVLPLALDTPGQRGDLEALHSPGIHADGPIRVVLGPQEDRFTASGIEAFLASEYTVTPQSDRMGLRLAGEALEHSRGHDIPSDGIATGSIQVPGNGLPIVLLADHQTTGGYPKIATVASVDIPRLGRLRPGDAMTFRAVTVEEAEALRRGQEAAIRASIDGLRPVDDRSHAEKLFDANLISGVVAGDHIEY